MNCNNESIVTVSEDYYTYLSTLVIGHTDDSVMEMFHMREDGHIIITESGERVIPSGESTYDFDVTTHRWGLVKRFRQGGMEIHMAVNLAIRMYNTIPAEVVLTDSAVNELCAHYANDGDPTLIFMINNQGELSITPPTNN